MPPRVNCEVFQIRTGTRRLTADRGMGITDVKGALYIDPQIERYHTSWGPSDPENLKLRLSKSLTEKLIELKTTVEAISLNALIAVGRGQQSNLFRYRADAPVRNPVGRYALIGVVNHDFAGFRFRNHEGIAELSRYVKRLDNPGWRDVGMYLVPEGQSLFVEHDIGHYGGGMTTFKATYLPDSEQGLVVNKYYPDKEIPPTPPPDLSGDREPRNPTPSRPSVHV